MSESLTGQRLEVTCCIAGSGSAGIMLGLLLPGAGVDVGVEFAYIRRGVYLHKARTILASPSCILTGSGNFYP
ncbi:MAG: hypothetical protein USCGTAYLOR_02998 [Chromatiales bacterium USCg_Taylor]|nr:MAG: hypothetical protein USCGTAYLOR_02998 [Chromatiales bacterium USCg_Taylor]